MMAANDCHQAISNFIYSPSYHCACWWPGTNRLVFFIRSGFRSLAPQKWCSTFNTLRPRRNRQHFADDIFNRIFFNENIIISIQISLKFVSIVPINNIRALVQIMAWCRSGDKPLSEPMVVSLATHICVTRHQWVKRVIAKHMLWITFVSNYHEIVLKWMPQNIFDKPTLV